MNAYKKGFYTLLSIYEKFSGDPQIGIFAFGLFTFITSMNFLSLWYLVFYILLGNYQTMFPYELVIAGTVFLFNVLYFFANKDARHDEYIEFRSQKKRSNYYFLILYMILSVACVVFTATQVRNEKRKFKKHTKTEISVSNGSAIGNTPYY